LKSSSCSLTWPFSYCFLVECFFRALEIRNRLRHEQYDTIPSAA
jgi:hypothetical protein